MDSNIDRQVEVILADIKERNEKVSALNEEINCLVKTLEEKLRTLKNLNTTPQTFVSRLVSTPEIKTMVQVNPNIATSSSSSNSITLAEKFKHPKEYIEAFERISKYYDYKSNNSILRNMKIMKYPRYICLQNADPQIVRNLLLSGFVDRIYTDKDLVSISKLPSILVKSMENMMEGYGKDGVYGIQVFDACTDLIGKPILLCQIFRVGKRSEVDMDNTSLKTPVPFNLEKFGEWLCNKRAIGISTLKDKLEGIIRGKKACTIAYGQGGDIEDIITLYYNNDIILTADTTNLSIMLDKVAGLKHKHAQRTIEIANQIMKYQRSQAVVSVQPLKIKPVEEGCSNPFG